LLENDSQSLVGSSNLYDSICDSHRTLHVDVSTAADDDDDDDFSSVGSISALFSVDNQSMPSDDCSFNYSLCSDSFSTRARGPSSQALFIFRQFFDKDSGTINTLDFDYNNCAMLRHAGLDYKSRTLPNDAISTSSLSKLLLLFITIFPINLYSVLINFHGKMITSPRTLVMPSPSLRLVSKSGKHSIPKMTPAQKLVARLRKCLRTT